MDVLQSRCAKENVGHDQKQKEGKRGPHKSRYCSRIGPLVCTYCALHITRVFPFIFIFKILKPSKYAKLCFAPPFFVSPPYLLFLLSLKINFQYFCFKIILIDSI